MKIQKDRFEIMAEKPEQGYAGEDRIIIITIPANGVDEAEAEFYSMYPDAKIIRTTIA